MLLKKVFADGLERGRGGRDRPIVDHRHHAILGTRGRGDLTEFDCESPSRAIACGTPQSNRSGLREIVGGSKTHWP